MYLSIFLPWLLCIPLFVHSSPHEPTGLLISCGSETKQTVPDTGVTYIPDDGFTLVGNKTALQTKDKLLPILTTLRYFPDTAARKYCYTFQAIKGSKYLVRTIYYYGGFDSGNEPPVFDQIIGGTKWSLVNTTEDYANGLSSYYEIILVASVKTLSVCVARNNHTVSSPFISAIEVISLDDSMYNSTDFGAHALVTVARSRFGHEDTISFPEDPYYRLWQPFKDDNEGVVSSQPSLSTSDFWNKPPPEAFATGLTTSAGKKLDVKWPPVPLPSTRYYISLYFRDNRPPKTTSTWRVFNVAVNGETFYNNLNVTTDGVTVYAAEWPLSGHTLISLTPDAKSSIGPLINAGEIYQVMPLGGQTLMQDAIAMEEVSRSFDNPPSDWTGDPCLPHENSWTGVTCSNEKMPRVSSLDLSNFGISGVLDANINNLTALHHLWLGGNKLSGSIPEMYSLTQLETLHLENNSFSGPVPKSFATLKGVNEIFLQGNKLDGPIPRRLQEKKGITIRVSPKYHLSVRW